MPDATPKVSVILPIYNAGSHLSESIESILSQTFSDFELLLIDDGSTDSSAQLALKFERNDSRVKFYQNETNLGLISTLNKGLGLARGEFIARMDQDDISETNRFEEQVKVLINNPKIGLCASWYRLFGDRKNVEIRHPESHDDIVNSFLHTGNVIGHPTVMLRREILTRNGIQYDRDFSHAEDFELWARLSQHTELYNLPKFLLQYRTHSNQSSLVFAKVQNRNAGRVKASLIKQAFPTISEFDYRALINLLDHYNFDKSLQPSNVHRLLREIYESNALSRRFPKHVMAQTLRSIWYTYCRKSLPLLRNRTAWIFASGSLYLLQDPLVAIRNFLALLYHGTLKFDDHQEPHE